MTKFDQEMKKWVSGTGGDLETTVNRFSEEVSELIGPTENGLDAMVKIMILEDYTSAMKRLTDFDEEIYLTLKDTFISRYNLIFEPAQTI